MPVYYYSCEICLFTFTEAFDSWSHEELSRYIYNDEYALHDPEYLHERPKKYADMFCSLPEKVRDLSILDYGSGLGLLEKNLRSEGFGNIDSYDPFGNNIKPATASYDLITSFEVFEHHPDPHKLFEEMKSYLKPNGVLLFATLMINQGAIDTGIASWRYCVPRNGHISFYSHGSLLFLGRTHQFKYLYSFSDELHILFNSIDDVWYLKKQIPIF